MDDITELMNELDHYLSDGTFQKSINNLKEYDDGDIEAGYIFCFPIIEDILYKYTSLIVENKEFQFYENKVTDKLEYALILSPTRQFLDQTFMRSYINRKININDIRLLLILKNSDVCRVMITYNDNKELPYNGDIYLFNELSEDDFEHFEDFEDPESKDELNILMDKVRFQRKHNVFYFDNKSHFTSLKRELNISNMECQLKDRMIISFDKINYAIENSMTKVLVELIRFIYVNMDFINSFNSLVDGEIRIEIHVGTFLFETRSNGQNHIEVIIYDNDGFETRVIVMYSNSRILESFCESDIENPELDGDTTELATEILNTFKNKKLSYELFEGNVRDEVYPKELSDVIYSFLHQ